MPRTKRGRKRGGARSSKGGGYNNVQRIRIKGRLTHLAIGASAATTQCLAPLSAPTSTGVSLNLELVGGFWDTRVLAFGNLFDEWKLHSLRLEFVQIASISDAFSLGIEHDGGAGLSSPSYETIIALQSSRSFNTGSGLKQTMMYRPPSRWLYTSNQSQSTVASFRQCSPGTIYGAWYTAPATPQAYGSLVVHYDLSFRGPINQSVGLRVSTKTEKDEPDSPDGVVVAVAKTDPRADPVKTTMDAVSFAVIQRDLLKRSGSSRERKGVG